MRRKTLVSVAACATLLIGSAGAARQGMAHQARDFSGTLTVYDWGALEVGPVGKRLIAEYEKMHPNVKIQIIAQDPDPSVYIQRVLAAGTAPDILMPSYTQETFNSIPDGSYLDLSPYMMQPDPYVPGNRHWVDLIDPIAHQENSFLGKKWYVFDWSTQDCAVFYNKDAFAKAGIAGPPATWANLITDLQKLKQAGYIPWFHALGEPFPIAENGWILTFLEGQVMTKTFRAMDLNHDGQVDLKELLTGIKHRIYSPMNADYQEAWRLLKEWSQYWEPNYAGQHMAPNTLPQSWVNGKVGMYLGGQYALGLIPGAKLPFKWGVVHFPWITAASSKFASATQPDYGVWGAWNADSWGVPAATQKRGHLQMALDFIYWLTAPKNEVPAALENGFTPVAKGYVSPDPVQRSYGDILQHPVPIAASLAALGNGFFRDRISAMQGYLIGVSSLQQTMQTMQTSLDKWAARIAKITGLTIS